ncbi:MAG: MATE family efflux transporter [Velocimicrobium sp.]
MKTLDLLNDNIKKIFFKYLFPSVGATIVTSIYILVDTIMIGKGIGSHAVAGLNIILPLFSILFGIGYLFGSGGAILMSVSLGRGDTKKASQYFSTALFLITIVAVFFTILLAICFEPLLQLLGATDNTYYYVTEYGRIFIIGAPFFIFSPFLQIFVRNDKAVKKAMVGVAAGGILNIILDYIFIFLFHLGMAGASLATVIGSFITFLILCSHFLTKNNTLRFRKRDISFYRIKNIIGNGLSTFFIEISSGIVIFAFNHQLIAYSGVAGVTVYSIISNTAAVVSSLNNGIAQAAQPIISRNFGAGKKNRVQITLRYGLGTAFGVGAVFMIIGLLFPAMVTNVFLNPTEEIYVMAKPAIQLYSLAFLTMAGNIFLNTYFQAILCPKTALLISFLRGFILNLAFLYFLPHVFGVNGIWITMPATELITLFTAFILFKKKGAERSKMKNGNESGIVNIV